MLCAGLLWRGYRRSRRPLLFWSSLCFAGLTLDNLFLFADRILLPAVDLSLYRQPTALGGRGRAALWHDLENKNMTPRFLMGAIAMGFATAGLFFLRYWRESRDRLFAWFAVAFFVLAFNRALPVLPAPEPRNHGGALSGSPARLPHHSSRPSWTRTCPPRLIRPFSHLAAQPVTCNV